MELVAEGIERDVEAAFLRGEGIKIGQGYLYCRPHPLDEICAWLGQHYLSPARPAAPAKALPPPKAA